MGFVPIEKLTKVIENPYEAILVAAKDARIQNSILALQDVDPNDEQPKVTSVALQRLADGEIDYYYNKPDEPEAEAIAQEDEEEND